MAELVTLAPFVASLFPDEIPAGLQFELDIGTAKTITNATNATPIVVTATAHGFASGQTVEISGVAGNTAANGYWVITVVDANSFRLEGSSGNGTYAGGGTAQRKFRAAARSLAIGKFQVQIAALGWNLCSVPGGTSGAARPRRHAY